MARADVFDYIEVLYNQSRRHSHLGGVSPEAFEREAEICLLERGQSKEVFSISRKLWSVREHYLFHLMKISAVDP